MEFLQHERMIETGPFGEDTGQEGPDGQKRNLHERIYAADQTSNTDTSVFGATCLFYAHLMRRLDKQSKAVFLLVKCRGNTIILEMGFSYVPRIGLIQRYVSPTWKCALIGGISSIPLTVSLYWLSGMGHELSLNMVFVGGVLTGFLAKIRITDANGATAGIRAGIIGATPGLLILADVLEAATALSGPVWFRSVALAVVVGTFVVVLFGLSALVGLLGAKVGGWLSEMDRLQRPPFVSN